MLESPKAILRNYIKSHKDNNKLCEHCNQTRELLQLIEDLEKIENNGWDINIIKPKYIRVGNLSFCENLHRRIKELGK